MKGQKDGTYNIMRKFRITEISGVHAGAMGEGSNMAIIKRAPEDLAKRVAMTDPMEGHSHTLELDHGSGELTAGHTSYDDDHSHPWIIGPDGQIVLGAADGHTHRVGFFSKSGNAQVGDVLDETHITSEQMSAGSKDDKTADKTAREGNEDQPMEPTEAELKLQEKIDALTKSLEKATKLAEMSDAEKAYLKGLSGDEAEAFLNSDNRAEIVKAANEKNPVVGNFEGREIRKSDDPTGVITALIQKAAKDAKKLEELKQKSEKKDLEKRAGELGHLPGSLETKVEMLKALDGIEDEGVRKSALESLVAKNASAADDFVENGTSSDNEIEKSGEDTLDTMAKALMAEDSSLTYEQAFTKALMTDEGQAVYNKSLEG